jgi:hypothetical protein
MTKNKNELTTTTSTEVAAYTEADMAEWGGSELSSNSELVKTNPKLRGGEYVHSVTGESFGSEVKDVVPFHMEKSFTVEKLNAKGKWEWDHTEKMTIDNENSPYEFQTPEGQFRRKYTYRFYVMVEGHILPFSVKFKGASKKTGSNLATEMFVKNKMKGLPPAAYSFTLTSKLEKNDDGDSYFTAQIVQSGRTPYEKVMEALNWFKTIRQSDQVVVDEDKEF